jgi:DNA polymerase III delta prime subunit
MEYIDHRHVYEKLDYFLQSKKIPNIIFHGLPGTGKNRIMAYFLLKIYDNDIVKVKSNTMMVNCSHGKGIKFIRDELKFFAKTNIESNFNTLFKSIVLLNADSLTIDAQSALRRCIELFSKKTRFFIIIENKHKLLNPIISRFCDIYIPETMTTFGICVNLHASKINNKFILNRKESKDNDIISIITNDKYNTESLYVKCIAIATELYNNAYCVNDFIHVLPKLHVTYKDTNNVLLYYYQIKPESRCEKMVLFLILVKYFSLF